MNKQILGFSLKDLIGIIIAYAGLLSFIGFFTYEFYLSSGWIALLFPLGLTSLVAIVVLMMLRQQYEPYQEPKAKPEEKIDLTKMGAPK